VLEQDHYFHTCRGPEAVYQYFQGSSFISEVEGRWERDQYESHEDLELAQDGYLPGADLVWAYFESDESHSEYNRHQHINGEQDGGLMAELIPVVDKQDFRQNEDDDFVPHPPDDVAYLLFLGIFEVFGSIFYTARG